MAKILIVDDEFHYRDPLQRVFSYEGFDVRTATSGQEALEVSRSFVPDVIVVDWMLRNHVDGLQVAEMFRVLNPRIQAILITGYLAANLGLHAQTHRFAQCLTKPFRLDDLMAAVRKAAVWANRPEGT